MNFIRRWMTPASWILPVMAGLMLRLPGLHQQVLGGDELHAVRAVLSMPLSEILTAYGVSDHSIPLAALYWISSKLTVLSEALLRMPILLSGAIVLIVVPWVLRGDVGRSAAMVLTWMLALSPGLVMYSTVAQPYMPVVLLGFGAAMCFYVWMEQRAWRAGGGYILLARWRPISTWQRSPSSSLLSCSLSPPGSSIVRIGRHRCVAWLSSRPGFCSELRS